MRGFFMQRGCDKLDDAVTRYVKGSTKVATTAARPRKAIDYECERHASQQRTDLR